MIRVVIALIIAFQVGTVYYGASKLSGLVQITSKTKQTITKLKQKTKKLESSIDKIREKIRKKLRL
jgi:uncharacterized protein Yka (UPF0111/DUF47 family)